MPVLTLMGIDALLAHCNFPVGCLIASLQRADLRVFHWLSIWLPLPALPLKFHRVRQPFDSLLGRIATLLSLLAESVYIH